MRLRLRTATTNGHIVHPSDDISRNNDGGMILTGKIEELEAKLVPLPLCPPQISHIDPGANPGLRGERPA
jgi:hypothetical protein